MLGMNPGWSLAGERSRMVDEAMSRLKELGVNPGVLDMGREYLEELAADAYGLGVSEGRAEALR